MSQSPSGAKVMLACLIALPLALLSGAQALSGAALRGTPDRALAVFPWNGLANEQVAYRIFADAVRQASGIGAEEGTYDGATAERLLQSAQLTRFAAATEQLARDAFRREPLAARALVMLALSQSDAAQRGDLIEATARLTRRDQVLQILLLEQRSKAGDYAATINTLDAILRARPERRDVFFPVLAEALGERAAAPAFVRLLAQPLPWRESFLDFAVAEEAALANLAQVRERIALEDRDFDRKLIARLVATGRIAQGARIYALAAEPRAKAAGEGTESWRADYPPFDWQLADQPGFRAQAGDTPDTLVIEVKPGNGGVIASRLMRNPGGPFVLRMQNAIEPAAQAADMKLAVTCGGQGAPFFERGFAPESSTFSINAVPACPYLGVSIIARAWTGGRPLRAQLEQLRMTPERP